MSSVLFLVHAVVLVLMWGLVLAAVAAVRSDFFAPRSDRRPATASAKAPAPNRPAARPPAKERKRSTARVLAVTGGPLSGTTIPLGDSPITIGRADSSTVVISDDYVSTNHARLVPRGDAWLIEDVGSTNGTFLDRSKITAATPVPIGVPIRIGKTTMELRK